MYMHYFHLIQSFCLYFQACLWDTGKIRHVLLQDPCDYEPNKAATLISPCVEMCNPGDRTKQWVVADLEGTLTRSKRSFPYYMLVAIEAGSSFRALLLLILSPFIWMVQTIVSENLGIQMLIFISTVGVRAFDVESVGRAVLCRFYLQDLHPQAYQVFVSCGKRCVVTSSPRIMVEPFLKDFLGVEHILGTELHTIKGFCTGFVQAPGVLVGHKKRDALRGMNILRQQQQFDVGISDHPKDCHFLSLCKEAYMVPCERKVHSVPKEQYLKPLIFHDGRLVRRPTELTCLCVFLWLPIGFLLAVLRICVWIFLPMNLALPLFALLGVRIRVQSPASSSSSERLALRDQKGILYVCTHKTVMDGMVLSMAVGKKTAVAIYSVSKFVEALTPMRTVRLVRDRVRDAEAMRKVLKNENLTICPEGTTCREPYLLRFSSLFAELSDTIVPVGLNVHQSLFHGSTARGNKIMDPLFFFMNPSPMYTVNILKPLTKEESCASGRSAFEVANYVQMLLGLVMGYECTQFTRKHKYRILAGNDGIVSASN